MSVPCYLGDLKYLRIWHDNSGKGRFASWYLQYILVRNVQTGEMTTFVCNEWLAVEYDDGLIDRLIPVAGKEQMRDFATVFPHQSQQSLSDGHLWFSVFLRPPRSRFTRMQRVSCCFALLFLSMMVNAMWYERVPSKPSAGSIKFGPLSLSPEQIAVGIMSNIIVFVPSLLIVFLFRKSRPRKLRMSRIDKAMSEAKTEGGAKSGRSGNDTDEKPEESSSRKGSLASSSHGDTSAKNKKVKKRRFTLPWWGVIIGWILCIVCLFGSAFIVYAYGITFGNEKATKWVTSLFISLFSSILLIQPLKVFLSALVISAIFKNVDLDSDDANEDEQDPQLAPDEEWFAAASGKTRTTGGGSSPYDKETLEKMRKQRLKEIEMGVIVREIISYSFFLWILFVLSYDNRDPNSFYLQKNLENAFIKIGDYTNFHRWLDFSRVSNTSAFWYWSQNVILQELRAQTWYNGITPAYGLRGFLDDRVNRIVGRATMRQVRSRPDTCTIHSGMRSLIGGCQGYTSIVSEETSSFCANWTRRGSRADCNRVEYRYSTGSQLQGLPIVAKQDVYGGGGYVFHFAGRTPDVLERMAQLERENWIDSLTRAVFVEFSVYNAQANLFGVATIYVEMTPGGGMHPWWRFDGIRLLKQAGSQAFVIVCEILYFLFIFYFIVREVRLIRKKRKEYFKQYSAYAEWAIILLSFTGLIVYIMRFIETDKILTIFKDTNGGGYVRLNYAQLLDDLYGYIIGIIVFIATLKFIKLLRFNRRIGMLSATLKQTWNDLTGFFAIFTIAIGSFGLLFNLLLVAYMDDFKDFLSAVESCFAMMLNKFEFMEMYRSSFLAAMMFFLFAIYMNIIFVNVLLTIILKGFEQVKNDVTKQPNDYEVVDFVMRRFKKFLGINSVTPLKDIVTEHQREEQESKDVRQLPDKVSTFIDQINHTYFDGKLDLNDKKMLKKTLRQAKHEQRGRPKSMEGFQRDDDHMTEDQKHLDEL
ncbi:polycystic kidney disease protein 1-like 2 [Amphibalanus amphitrite]|nr:polycystic kidney disease protein 1-like 2 [Amphibalanus amphitrite]